MKAKTQRPDYLFLDCEWADIAARDLVSIGLCSMDDQCAFYAEVDHLPDDPTPWVKAVVYPLLERGQAATSVASMSNRLHAFLASFERPLVCYDHTADRDLCELILLAKNADSDRPADNRPEWILLSDVAPALKRWWVEHPELQARRHHALVDARALRAAYLSMWGI